jgi:glucose/arabinose dehydrogenase
VPVDNPFVGDPKARPEVWAYGLRNVWRFSFDRETGELWAGDVGQDRWEEINLIKKGLNYGWNVKEGRHDFRPQGRAGPFEPPVVEHAHPEAQSITGGNVYRGKKHPDLRGAYLYADYITGLVWLLRREGEKVTEHRRIGRGELIASFGEDRHGEVYFTSYDGRIYTFDR